MKYWILFLCTVVPLSLVAQLSIDNAGTTYTIDFDNSITGVNNGQYTGSGLQPAPSPGQLNGDAWEIIGLSAGDHLFGDNNASGDFARGGNSGGVGIGGLYSFVVGGGDVAFGFQSTGSDLNPGEIKLKLTNNTGTYIVNIEVSYEIWVYNDQNRETKLDFSWSYGNGNYLPVPSLDYTSPAANSGSSWSLAATQTISIGVVVPDGSSIHLNWETQDGPNGSGSRDEIAIDDIQVTAQTDDNPLIITEIMANPEVDETGTPSSLGEPAAEWFEVYNNTSYDIELDNLILEDAASTSYNIAGSTLIGSKNYYVLARDAGVNIGGFGEDHIYGSIQLNNAGDLLRIKYPDGSIIDEVDFSSWPGSILTAGQSMYFSGTATDNNNDQANWAASTVRELTYAGSNPNSDKGSPGIAGSGQLLPLWITDFNGIYAGGEIQLAWKVEQVQEIERFEVEVSKEGQHFERIGAVNAIPHTLRYNFAKAYDMQDVVYVRLKQVDKAGTVFYSRVINLSPRKENGLLLYPNPVGNAIFLKTVNQLENAQYQILDASGKLVRQDQINGPRIDLHELPAGCYHLQLFGKQTYFNKTFLKQ